MAHPRRLTGSAPRKLPPQTPMDTSAAWARRRAIEGTRCSRTRVESETERACAVGRHPRAVRTLPRRDGARGTGRVAFSERLYDILRRAPQSRGAELMQLRSLRLRPEGYRAPGAPKGFLHRSESLSGDSAGRAWEEG